MDPEDPRNPAGLNQGLTAAGQQPAGDVGQICEGCRDNWVEAGAKDDASGQPLAHLPYRIYDVATGEVVARGVTDENGEGPRHPLPLPVTQLYVVYGQEAAMNEAEAQLEEMRRQQALQANAVSEWRGFEAGLTREQFDQKHWERTRSGDMVVADRGFLGQAARGAAGLGRLPGAIGEAVFGDGVEAAAMEYYEPYRDEAWEQYQLATGARAASSGESFGAGVPQGLTFGFDEEISAALNSMVDPRSYDEIVEAQRQVLRANQISNPGAFLGGEVVGAIPTVFIPVGGAAANAARGGRSAMIAGGRTGAATGGLSGFGHDEGGFVERLDGAAIGAGTGGVGGAVLAGAGVLVARGVSKTRIWARSSRKPQPGTLDNKATREWYHEQERLIPSRLDPDAPLETQARQAHALRNEARTTARDLMSDRAEAARLAREHPNLTWDEIVEKTVNKGYEGDEVYRQIIESSQRSNSAVNKKLGLE